MRMIVVQPMGFGDKLLLRHASGLAASALPVEYTVVVSQEEVHLSAGVYDFSRGQVDAARVNRLLYDLYRDFVEPPRRLVVGVTRADGYVDGLNFVFGLAEPRLGVASVYARRLEAGDPRLFAERLAKEIAHEVGHLLGLGHCSTPGCVMNFSNSLAEVDAKRLWFCEECRRRVTGLF
ncbi:MAG: archaemetzincin family Zn-dependent metalloprotease [Desulfurococcales archaeon]|nr:archaemetzincin family Zn-dependent metalloprotease [Desulfurococcales archaeon]